MFGMKGGPTIRTVAVVAATTRGVHDNPSIVRRLRGALMKASLKEFGGS